MERRTNENEETREFDHTDFYQMYQDEMDCIVPCTAQEMEDLSEELLNGSETARKRLVEGCLFWLPRLQRSTRIKDFQPGIWFRRPTWLF